MAGATDDQQWDFFIQLLYADEDPYGRMPGLVTNHPVWLTTSNDLYAEHSYHLSVGRPLAVSSVAVIITASAQRAFTTSGPDHIGIIHAPRYLFPDMWEGVQGPVPTMEEDDVNRVDKWIAYYPRRDATLRVTFPPYHPYLAARLVDLTDPFEDPYYRYKFLPAPSATPTPSHVVLLKTDDQTNENYADEEDSWSSESDDEF